MRSIFCCGAMCTSYVYHTQCVVRLSIWEWLTSLFSNRSKVKSFWFSNRSKVKSFWCFDSLNFDSLWFSMILYDSLVSQPLWYLATAFNISQPLSILSLNHHLFSMFNVCISSYDIKLSLCTKLHLLFNVQKNES